MSRKETSGLLVITGTGQHGRTYHKIEPINGKIVVYLTQSVIKDFKPILDEKGQQKKILCDPKTLTIIGRAD